MDELYGMVYELFINYKDLLKINEFFCFIHVKHCI